MMKLEDIGFSKRERETLSYLVKGYKYEYIGNSMGISKRTIECYVKNMRVKVDAYSKDDLIKKVTKLLGWDLKNLHCVTEIWNEEVGVKEDEEKSKRQFL